VHRGSKSAVRRATLEPCSGTGSSTLRCHARESLLPPLLTTSITPLQHTHSHAHTQPQPPPSPLMATICERSRAWAMSFTSLAVLRGCARARAGGGGGKVIQVNQSSFVVMTVTTRSGMYS
jgi:hypothetical protein